MVIWSFSLPRDLAEALEEEISKMKRGSKSRLIRHLLAAWLLKRKAHQKDPDDDLD